MGVGTSVKRLDAIQKVTGSAKYVEDLIPLDALHMKVVHSTIANGLVTAIDTTEAERMPGVELIITCFDVPDVEFVTAGHPLSLDPAHADTRDKLILAKRVLYYGDDVAAVIADTPLNAQLAAEKAPEDDYLVHFDWHDARMTQFMGESHKLVGWGLIALGAIVFYNNIIMRVLGDVMWRWGQDNPVFRAIYLMLDALPQIVVCVALIVCGMWLVRGPKNKKGKQPPEEETEEPEDFHAYTAAPQAEDAEDTADTDTHFAMPELSALLGEPVTGAEQDETPAEDDDDRAE